MTPGGDLAGAACRRTMLTPRHRERSELMFGMRCAIIRGQLAVQRNSLSLGPPGHFAIGLAAKPTAPKAPLWVLLVATEVSDLLFFAFQAAGIEKAGVSTIDFSRGVKILSPGSIPWSHRHLFGFQEANNRTGV
jgi:hypothetical protein